MIYLYKGKIPSIGSVCLKKYKNTNGNFGDGQYSCYVATQLLSTRQITKMARSFSSSPLYVVTSHKINVWSGCIDKIDVVKKYRTNKDDAIDRCIELFSGRNSLLFVNTTGDTIPKLLEEILRTYNSQDVPDLKTITIDEQGELRVKIQHIKTGFNLTSTIEEYVRTMPT